MIGIGVIIAIVIAIIFYFLKKYTSETSTITSFSEAEPQLGHISESLEIDTPTLKPNEWGLILSLPYSCFNGHAYNDYNKGPHDGGLSQAWRVFDRYSLIQQLYWLITSGHTNNYYLLRDQVSYANKVELQDIIQEVENSSDSEENKKEQLWRIEMMDKNVNDICNVKYIAWDFVRFSKLCLDGCRAGYITIQEAQDWSLMSASMIKRIYTGWEDFWGNFLQTRWLWAANDSNWSESQQEFADKIQEILFDTSYPITQETWDLNLPAMDLESFTRAVAGVGFTTEDGTPVSLSQLEASISQRLISSRLDS
ncbi:DUF1266 domain-containing protein [Providencia manganoxydans]|uniref:DUF1266 domain-containing protein n=1 Tax=Providencia manganoxydans TaxID=2923283 RepID=UPI0032DACF5B